MAFFLDFKLLYVTINEGESMKKIGISICIITLCFFAIFLYFYHQNKLFENNFHEVVKVQKETKVYNENQQEIGIIYPNTILELEKTEKKQYRIKDTDYYIDYHYLEKADKNILPKLLVFNRNIVTNSNFNLYQEDHQMIEWKETKEFEIYKENETTYTIFFLNQYFEISKDEIKEIKEVKNTEQEYAEKIPVLYFNKIENNHQYNNSIRESRYQEIIQYIDKQELNKISVDTYQEWVNGKIKLPKNSILLLSDKKNLDEKIDVKPDNIPLTNEQSFPFKPNAFQINNTITLADIKTILKGSDLINVTIDDTKLASKIPVLNYHFFYGEGEVCTESICLSLDKLEEQFQYLNQNGYKTLTMREYIDWYNGTIELPEKSVLLTIDDGAMGTSNHLPFLLDQYQIHATLFLITAWWPKENYVSDYLDIESHGYDIHLSGTCGKAKLLCLKKDEKIKDLKQSISLLNTSQAFCYPFYKYDNTSIKAVEEAGFEVAFAGGFVSSTRNSNRYLIPRYPIYNTITLNQFINMIQ